MIDGMAPYWHSCHVESRCGCPQCHVDCKNGGKNIWRRTLRRKWPKMAGRGRIWRLSKQHHTHTTNHKEQTTNNNQQQRCPTQPYHPKTSLMRQSSRTRNASIYHPMKRCAKRLTNFANSSASLASASGRHRAPPPSPSPALPQVVRAMATTTSNPLHAIMMKALPPLWFFQQLSHISSSRIQIH